MGHSVYEKKEPVQKKLNPAKACNLFLTTKERIRNPLLGLPRLEREDIGHSIRLAIQELRKIFRMVGTAYGNMPSRI